jgi:peptidoglycan/xylan/chitin deacetylase (PgdA/CDA1 family)
MSVRRTIRSLLDHAALASGVVERRERAMLGSLTILTYHRVLPSSQWKGAPLPGLVMPLSCFEQQVRSLARRFEVVTVSKGLARLRVGARDDKPLIALTFDDGYDDNHAHAAGILETHGVRGTFYLVSDFVGTDVELWFDEAARWFGGSKTPALDALVEAIGGRPTWARGTRPIVRAFMGYLKSHSREDRDRALAYMRQHPGSVPRRGEDVAMSLDDAKDLARRGHEIGAHTATHPLLPQEDDASLAREVAGCKARLESMLGLDVRGFCYPNGDVDERVARAVREAGFAHAVTVARGRNTKSTDPYCLHRLDMNSARVLRNDLHDEAIFRAELAMLHSY